MKITKQHLRRIIRESIRSSLLETYNEQDRQKYRSKVENLLSDQKVDSFRIGLSLIDAMADKDPDFANELLVVMSIKGREFQNQLTSRADGIYHGPKDPNERHAWKKARAGAPGARQLVQQDQTDAEAVSLEMEQLSSILSDATYLQNKIQYEIATDKPFNFKDKKAQQRFGRKA